MLIPFPIQETIDTRRSSRSFKRLGVDPQIMEEIKNYAKNMAVPFDHSVEIRFFKAEDNRTLYPLMRAPQDNVAFITETDHISISKAGFVGEMLILFAQSKGLRTCWYGHYKLKELERMMPHLTSSEHLEEANMGYGYSKGVVEGRRAICISPLGYGERSGLRLMDRLTEKTVSHKRKDILELLEHQEDYAQLSHDWLFALDMARKAPSAANAQMWRFGFEENFKTVSLAMPLGYRHFKWEHPNVDIGICACHLWLGLLEKGHLPVVSLEEAGGRVIWRMGR